MSFAPRTLAWRKSSASGTGNCVEVALDGGSILVRDTKDRAGQVLVFTEAEWAAFVIGVNSGEFTLDALRVADQISEPVAHGGKTSSSTP